MIDKDKASMPIYVGNSPRDRLRLRLLLSQGARAAAWLKW
jgi:hypothetical protein